MIHRIQKRNFALFLILLGVVLGMSIPTRAHAQQVQIPSLQVCNKTAVQGEGGVEIVSRGGTAFSGTFTLRIRLRCPNPSGYPDGGFEMDIDMNDSAIQGPLASISLEQVTTTGRRTPTVFLNGRCKAEQHFNLQGQQIHPQAVKGCRFWMMIADNKKADEKRTHDVVSFLILDGQGNRMAYGTGPVLKGDFEVAPTLH